MVNKIRKFILLIATVTFIISASYLVYHQISKNIDKNKITASVAESNSLSNLEVDGYSKEYRDDPRIKNIYKQNQDVVGWIKIENTSLDYPVFKAKDDVKNEFYIRKGIDKKYNLYGLPFVDYKSSIDPLSKNVVIYGHNMGAEDVMFGLLKHYNKFDRYCSNSASKALQFYKDHPIINFDTLLEENKWKIFSVFIMDGEDASEFQYVKYINEDDGFETFLEQAQKRSLIKTAVDVDEDDEFLTLSTCTYELASGKLRLVVVARKLRPDEPEDCNVEKAETASRPLMPKCWYDYYGGTATE